MRFQWNGIAGSTYSFRWVCFFIQLRCCCYSGFFRLIRYPEKFSNNGLLEIKKLIDLLINIPLVKAKSLTHVLFWFLIYKLCPYPILMLMHSNHKLGRLIDRTTCISCNSGVLERESILSLPFWSQNTDSELDEFVSSLTRRNQYLRQYWHYI